MTGNHMLVVTGGPAARDPGPLPLHDLVIAADSGAEHAPALGLTVDVLVGGPPCQGHSDLNNHTRRADEKNALFDRMARFVQLARPSHVIVENVKVAEAPR